MQPNRNNSTLKNIHSGKELKKLNGGNCRTANIVYAVYWQYIGNTGEKLRRRFNKHRYDAKHKPDNNGLASHIHKYQHDFEKDIEILI